MSNHYEDTIWKQITTWYHKLHISNCCEQSLRRYNLKANHNLKSQHPCIAKVVSNHYEDTIWKQITTVVDGEICVWCCEQSLRRYNLKANHNSFHFGIIRQLLWAIITKIQSESKSQRTVYTFQPDPVVSNHYEDTIWKQITTRRCKCSYNSALWAIITKIQSESKSQQYAPCFVCTICCEQSLRRYNLKANHNVRKPYHLASLVVSNHYEDTIWKQITTCKVLLPLLLRCEQSLRRYNLKANHNENEVLVQEVSVVSNHYEDTIWKQITT